MRCKVYVEAHNIISPLGQTSDVNFTNLVNGKSSIIEHNIILYDEEKFWASIFNETTQLKIEEKDQEFGQFSKFEQLLICSIQTALESSNINPTDHDVIIIISTTKGNIELLELNKDPSFDVNLLKLNYSANKIAQYFKNPNRPILVSNACISGVNAIILGKRLIEQGKYNHAIVVGGDTFSKFVYSGFKSFQALSRRKCAPFSKKRDGINLGEAFGTICLTNQISEKTKVMVMGGATGNDANHISGPSRTGFELSQVINKTLLESKLKPQQIDFISAHGTATIYNDEMEAKAIKLSNLQHSKVNSLKGYFGHTLGAAGIIESIICVQSVLNKIILSTNGYEDQICDFEINISNNNVKQTIHHCLKIASGFGGCNSALIYSGFK